MSGFEICLQEARSTCKTHHPTEKDFYINPQRWLVFSKRKKWVLFVTPSVTEWQRYLTQQTSLFPCPLFFLLFHSNFFCFPSHEFQADGFSRVSIHLPTRRCGNLFAFDRTVRHQYHGHLVRHQNTQCPIQIPVVLTLVGALVVSLFLGFYGFNIDIGSDQQW